MMMQMNDFLSIQTSSTAVQPQITPIPMPRIHDPIFMEIDSGLKAIIIIGVKAPITITERSWNSGNLPYFSG